MTEGGAREPMGLATRMGGAATTLAAGFGLNLAAWSPALAQAAAPAGAGWLAPAVMIAAIVALAAALWARQASRARDAALAEAKTLTAELEAKADRQHRLARLGGPASALYLWDGPGETVARAGGERAPGDDSAEGAGLSIARLAQGFGEADGARLADALAALIERGQSFEIELRAPDRRAFRAEGRVDGGYAGLRLTDVTEAREAEAERAAKLSAAEEARNALLEMSDSAQAPVWRRDDEGRLIYVNGVYAQAVEQKSQDIVVAEQIELTTSPDDDAPRKLALDAIEADAIKSARRMLVVGGQWRVYEIVEAPMPSGGSMGYARDTTREHEVEAELTRSNESFTATLDMLSAAVMVYGADQRLRYFNDAATRLLRLDREWLEDGPEYGALLDALRDRNRLPATTDYGAWKRERLDLFRTLVEPREELKHLSDGVMLRSIVAPHPAGGLVFLDEDVSTQIDLERKHNTALGVHRATLDALTEGLAVFGSDGLLKLSNPAFAGLWRIDPERLANGPHVTDVVAGARALHEDEGFWRDVVEDVTAIGPAPEPHQARVERRDGVILDYRRVALPDGAALLAFADVSDSIRAERALVERNEALTAADKMKGEFLGHASYQLRTPLNTIVGFSEILAEEMFGPLNERQQDYVGAVRLAANELRALISDMIDLGSIQAGKFELTLGPAPCRPLLAAAREFVGEKALANEVTIRVEAGEALEDVAIVADEARIRHALFTIVSNAVDVSEAGGEVRLGGARRDGEVTLWVEDAGPLVSEEERGVLFGAFESKSKRARLARGGVGLALARSIVELHRGHVEVEPGSQSGARVVLTLPAAAATATPIIAPNPPNPEPARGGERGHAVARPSR